MKRVWRLHEKIMILDIKKILKNKIKIRPTDPLQNLLCNPKHTFFWHTEQMKVEMKKRKRKKKESWHFFRLQHSNTT